MKSIDLLDFNKTPAWSLHHGDCIEWLASLAAECVDLIVTDPAYESLEKHRATGTTTRLKVSNASSNQWFPIFKNERFPALFEQLFRVLKKGTHCYVLCDQETMFVVKDIAPRAGFEWKKFLVWDKVKPGMGYNYRACHEVICFLSKGKRNGDGYGCLNDNKTADVLRCEEIEERGAILSHERVTGYPTEKPVGLLQDLIRMSSRPGELVLDPFVGSGSTGQAAFLQGRKFAGCDVSKTAIDMASRKLQETPFMARV